MGVVPVLGKPGWLVTTLLTTESHPSPGRTDDAGPSHAQDRLHLGLSHLGLWEAGARH